MHVNQILHSGKTRARQTSEILADRLIPRGGVEAAENLAPLDDPVLWASRLQGETENLMLVGHLPHLTRLASLLICGDAEKKAVDFKNGGIVCLGRDGEDLFSVMWIVTPDMVK
jgi:phosphohistidine phosphatase